MKEKSYQILKILINCGLLFWAVKAI